MNREELMNTVMKTRGLEDEKTILFCLLCEDMSVSDEAITTAFVPLTNLIVLFDSDVVFAALRSYVFATAFICKPGELTIRSSVNSVKSEEIVTICIFL